jgi:hypothetical protein
MSYTTITQCTRDEHFQDRVTAGAMKEAIASEVYSRTAFAEQLRSLPQAALSVFLWPLSVDNEADYAYAIDTGNADPGGDPGVVSDEKIQAGVQHYWPDETLPTPVIPLVP